MRRCTHLLLIFILLAACSLVQPSRQMTVIAHPDGPLYAGDQVSFEVLTPTVKGGTNEGVSVTFEGRELGQADFAPFGIGGRIQATLWWVWDTRDLKPGNYSLTFTLLPENISESETFPLHPADQVPPPEPGATWVSTTTVCCILHYITGTAASRDIASLSQVVDDQSALVSAQLSSKLSDRIDIVFIPRVIGHGGFTLGSIYVSYLDDNYIGNDMAILFHHEFVHYYDDAWGGVYLPSILQEGLAVYLSGGHFKPEPLMPRAEAMVELNWYIPLTTLANDFYNQQHDIGYLEAGALIGYLVETYGWDGFNEFYRTIPEPINGQTNSAVIDTALRDHFGISFSDLETEFLTFLHSQTVTEQELTDLQMTLRFYDSVRRYQQVLDPSAYFLTAWLPDESVMSQRRIVADFLRRPRNWNNQLLEALLIRAHGEYFRGDYKDAETTLRWTNWVMDVISP